VQVAHQLAQVAGVFLLKRIGNGAHEACAKRTVFVVNLLEFE
jgi:hypothetical protein